MWKKRRNKGSLSKGRKELATSCRSVNSICTTAGIVCFATCITAVVKSTAPPMLADDWTCTHGKDEPRPTIQSIVIARLITTSQRSDGCRDIELFSSDDRSVW